MHTVLASQLRLFTLALALSLPWAMGAQVVGIGSAADERLREAQILGRAPTDGYLLRSLSTLSAPLAGDSAALRWSFVAPHVLATYNSHLPFSLNDGALWAGRGASAIGFAGVRAEWGPVSLFVLPELTWSANEQYPYADSILFPPLHDLANPKQFRPVAGRSPFSSPFHGRQQSIDLPIRFGDRPITRLRAGQSSLVVKAGPVQVGASTENEWWGPGRQAALLLSNNAAGFGHAFVRTAHPVETRVGAFEGRWLVGGLRESDYFDGDPSNDLRSISLLALTWRPWFERSLTLGAARAVFAPTRGWGSALSAFPQVFADVGAPDARALTDTTSASGRDQLFSLFGRWVFPADGLEVYGEWGRAELPTTVRDFLLFPTHTQAYVLGLQWLGQPIRSHGRLHLYGEATYLEQSSTYRYRPLGSWYTSRAVAQGYTNEGQSLGAAIGPGSDSQLVGADYVTSTWRAGIFVDRIRWLEDAHSQYPYPNANGQGQCEHDVSFLPGVKGGANTALGQLTLSYSAGWRMNTFFENRDTFCPQSLGRNYMTKSLTIGFSPGR